MSMMKNGGIGGSGIFGMIGTVVKCDSTDNSMYCNLVKLVNSLILILFLGFVLYLVFMFFFPGFGRKVRGGFGKR